MILNHLSMKPTLKLLRMSDVPVTVNMLLSWLHVWFHQVDSGLWLRSCNLWDKGSWRQMGRLRNKKSLSALSMHTASHELAHKSGPMPKVKEALPLLQQGLVQPLCSLFDDCSIAAPTPLPTATPAIQQPSCNIHKCVHFGWENILFF